MEVTLHTGRILYNVKQAGTANPLMLFRQSGQTQQILQWSGPAAALLKYWTVNKTILSVTIISRTSL